VAAAVVGPAALAGRGAVVGLDIGGTLMKAVLVGPAGNVAGRQRQPTSTAQGPEAVVDSATQLLLRLQAAAGGELAAVGLAVPGLVDEEAGVARLAVNIGWRDLDVVGAVSARLGAPVRLGHDVRLGALAEGVLGAAKGMSDYLFLPVGTGIAAALTLEGRQRRGLRGVAGEIGHVVVDPAGPACPCGGRGCLEVMASAAAIARRYRNLVPGAPVGAAEVLALADEGDAAAAAIWRSAVGHIAGVVADLHSALDLELVVMGGGLANAGARLLADLSGEVARRLPLSYLGPPRIVGGELGDEAGCLGAALLARAGPLVQP
jgi:glucokinase